MKANIIDIEGKKSNSLELPNCFSEKIREDLINKIIETLKTKSPYAPFFLAGNQYSASGKLVHRRHVWKSQYGKGISRVPRKIMSKRGSQFNWVGATIPSTRGGRRAHPPKALAMINVKKINKKEMNLALKSAISATVNEKMIKKKYEKLRDEKIENFPIVVESKITKLKSKEFLKAIQKILGIKILELLIKKKKIRSGIGKMRGRKYKENAGLLLVIGNDEKLKMNILDIRNVNNLSIVDLASGGAGRFTIYTEKAIRDLEQKFKEKKE